MLYAWQQFHMIFSKMHTFGCCCICDWFEDQNESNTWTGRKLFHHIGKSCISNRIFTHENNFVPASVCKFHGNSNHVISWFGKCPKSRDFTWFSRFHGPESREIVKNGPKFPWSWDLRITLQTLEFTPSEWKKSLCEVVSSDKSAFQIAN